MSVVLSGSGEVLLGKGMFAGLAHLVTHHNVVLGHLKVFLGNGDVLGRFLGKLLHVLGDGLFDSFVELSGFSNVSSSLSLLSSGSLKVTSFTEFVSSSEVVSGRSDEVSNGFLSVLHSFVRHFGLVGFFGLFVVVYSLLEGFLGSLGVLVDSFVSSGVLLGGFVRFFHGLLGMLLSDRLLVGFLSGMLLSVLLSGMLLSDMLLSVLLSNRFLVRFLGCFLGGFLSGNLLGVLGFNLLDQFLDVVGLFDNVTGGGSLLFSSGMVASFAELVSKFDVRDGLSLHMSDNFLEMLDSLLSFSSLVGF